MPTITETAKAFFADCEAGKGWSVCRAYCTENASFSAQAEPLAEVATVEQYTDWMQGLLTVLTDGAYEVKSFATDNERRNVCAYAVFTGTHLSGGPCPPTGRTAKADYVYVMQFDGGLISHMIKIWHSGFTLQQLGWG